MPGLPSSVRSLSRSQKAGGLTGMALALAVSGITVFEGFAPQAHHDRIDPPGVNTICFGHIEGVKLGDRRTKSQCQDLLLEDIPRYDAMVLRQINVPLPPHRHAALLMFTYNLGEGALHKSSVRRYLNAGDIKHGCDAMLLYTHDHYGHEQRGLVRRRQFEHDWCLRED